MTSMDSEQELSMVTEQLQTIHITLNADGLKQLRPRISMVKVIRTSGMILIV